MEKVLATPKDGVLVRHADGKKRGQPLAADGEAVERNSYWLRRERDGDVTLSALPAVAPEEPAATGAGDKPTGKPAAKTKA